MRILFSRMIIKHVLDVIDSRLVYELLTSNDRQLFLHIVGDLFPRNFAFLRNFPKIKLSRNILNLMFFHFFGEKIGRNINISNVYKLHPIFWTTFYMKMTVDLVYMYTVKVPHRVHHRARGFSLVKR